MSDRAGMRVHVGGLMRCCIATLGERDDTLAELDKDIARDGTVASCKWCHGTMIARNGVWYWSGCPEVAEFAPKPKQEGARP